MSLPISFSVLFVRRKNPSQHGSFLLSVHRFRVGQGLNGEEEARKLGFESFREFLHSEEMATIAFVDNDENGNENGDECTRQSRTKRTLIFAWNK